jgi:hypothetical protein
MFAQQILDWHVVVNSTDNLDDWALSYCPLTGAAIAWAAFFEDPEVYFN